MLPLGYLEGEARASGIPDDLITPLSSLIRKIMDKQAIDERLNYQWLTENLQGRVAVYSIIPSTDLTLTTSMQEITGGEIEFTLITPSRVTAVGDYLFWGSVAGWGRATGGLVVDGASFDDDTTASLDEVTEAAGAVQGSEVSRHYTVDLAAGDHTIALEARKNINAGTVTQMAFGSTLTIFVT